MTNLLFLSQIDSTSHQIATIEREYMNAITKLLRRTNLISMASAAALCSLLPLSVNAASVSPLGVNVKAFSSTTVFLTFLGLNNQVPAEGLWCGAINANQSCVPGTIFGRLPQRYNLSRLSGGNNYTDIMTIPASVTRRAYQDAAQGNQGDFFYVRRLVSTTGGADEFVAVTCRLAAGGARVPLSLSSVKLELAKNRSVPAIATGTTLPNFGAQIAYNGTGRLKGRWELVSPGDPRPSQRDLLTEASLPLEERGLQQRYTQLERFDLFLPPTGQVFLPGPNPDRIPKGASGLHLILLRIEATDDREGDSTLTTGIVSSGGVAGFPMPVLRYFIGTSDGKLALIEPQADTQLSQLKPIQFTWQGIGAAGGYRLEIKDKDRIVLSALLSADRTTYTAPPWLKDKTQKSLTWRVQALKSDGSVLSESPSQQFQILAK
jgi:hypothetical protein